MKNSMMKSCGLKKKKLKKKEVEGGIRGQDGRNTQPFLSKIKTYQLVKVYLSRLTANFFAVKKD